ncbi:ABC transporter permease [Permianibacter sp. IMCC34836]|uniref:ABC transporter permease n=1 Tax=Permianibacter fluminis TaxID=2738515 RepID=UPI0015535A95|nr:ABC transporter permease [Permianibacter fluminis]NQD37967.1 ABC transporter permease [Permianibacter fluminis]
MKTQRIRAVIAKESRELVRDPVTMWLCFLMPLVMLFLFGYAVNLDVEDIKLGVLDNDRTAMSRDLIDRFTASHYFRLIEDLPSPAAAEERLRRGTLSLVLVIPPGTQRRLARSETAPIPILVDGSYAATSLLAAGYAETIVTNYVAQPARIEPVVRVWYNPSMKSVNYIIPGLYGVILMAFPPLLTALAIARERESGTIQQIYASPLTTYEFMLGKLVPYAIVASLEMALVVGLGYAWFDVPFVGNPLELLAVAVLYVLITVGIGLLVSTLAKTQVAAMLIALIIALMPSFLFSGFLFPVFSMPMLIQMYARIFPTSYFIDFSRGVVLKGVGVEVLWFNVLWLAIYTVVIFLLAARLLKKKVA